MRRVPGLSAMLRVKNEEEFLPYCLQSINDWFDEIIIADQNSTDDTRAVIEQYADPSKTTVYQFPYESRPNGPGFGQQPYDHYNRAYFYNWCLQLTTRQWVCKWDGDMVAMSGLGTVVRQVLNSGFAGNLAIKGIDIVKWEDGRLYVGKRAVIKEKDPRFFRPVPGKNHWMTGHASEQFIHDDMQAEISEPAYLHMKWCKPLEKATQAWPAGWEQQKHFTDIFERRKPVAEYTGRIPSCLIQTI